MNENATADDVIACLRRRADVVEHLREAPREKRELEDDLDLARSTLDRAVRELETADLVAYRDGRYELTAVGARLTDDYLAFVERTELTVELEPFLRWTTAEALDLDLHWLADADLWTGTPNDPYAMVYRHVALLGAAERVRGMTSVLGLHAMQTSRDRVVDGDAVHEFVVDAGSAETLREDESYAPLYRELAASDDCAFRVYDGEIPFYLGVFDDETVQIGVDEDGEPRALLETDRSEVRAWAHGTIDEFERQADGTVGGVSDAADV